MRRPASVVRYCCLELRGLSGRVISSMPASSSGRTTWSRNLVRSERPHRCMSSAIGCGSSDASSTWTWCQLSADLVPTWRRQPAPGPMDTQKVTTKAPPSSWKLGGSAPHRSHSSITRFVPRPQTSTAPVRWRNPQRRPTFCAGSLPSWASLLRGDATDDLATEAAKPLVIVALGPGAAPTGDDLLEAAEEPELAQRAVGPAVD